MRGPLFVGRCGLIRERRHCQSGEKGVGSLTAGHNYGDVESKACGEQ